MLVDDASPLNGVGYFDIDGVFVHGGLTFSDYIELGNRKHWAFGFDCAHYDDAPDIAAGEMLLDDAPTEIYDLMPRITFWGEPCHVWTLDDVIAELTELSSQIREIEGMPCEG